MFSQKNECIMRAAGKSAGQFPYLRLNELSGGSGKLIHPLNADEIVPVDRPCIGDAGVLAHKDSGDPYAALPQRPHFLRRVRNACRAVIAADEGALTGGEDAAAVVRTGIGQQDEQMPICRGGIHQLSRHAQRQSVPVPAGGKVIENFSFCVFFAEILEDSRDRKAAQTAKAADADGNAAGGQASGQNIALCGDGLLTVQARGRAVEQQIDGKTGIALLLTAEEYPSVVQHRQSPDAADVRVTLPGGYSVRLLLHLHAVADMPGQMQDGALIQVIVFEEIRAVPRGLLCRLIEKVLHIGTHGFAGRRLAPGKPEMAAEMVAGAGLLLDERELFWGIQTAAEAAFHIIPVFVLLFIGAQLCAQGVGRANHAVSACRRRAVNGQIVGADHLGREQTGQQRNPPFPEMQRERLFCMGIAVKVQVFPKGLADRVRKFLAAQRAGAGKRCRQAFFPRGQHGRLLSQNGFPARGLDGVHKLVFRHPFLPGKPVFRGEKSRGMRAPQSIQRRTLGQLFFVYGVFEREPRQIVVHGLTGVADPRGEQLFRHIVPEPLVHEADDAVQVEIGLAVRTHRQKLWFESVVAADGPDLIDGAPLAGAVSRNFHISRKTGGCGRAFPGFWRR